MAATDTGFEIRETLVGVINLQVAREPGQVNSSKSQQLTLVRPHTKDLREILKVKSIARKVLAATAKAQPTEIS
jgi:hypothetical protein